MTLLAEQVDWIAVDWGTTNLRAWAMDARDQPLAEAGSHDGMGRLEREGFEPALLALIGPWLAPGRVTPVICAGMVGARQGWAEAAYVSVPNPPPGLSQATRPDAHDPRISVAILPGMKQDNPPDVMRGEETQVAGYLHRNPDFDGVICLPGTHTKWARVAQGRVLGFRTVMTGELFGLLATQSVLRHGISASGWNDTAFATATGEALARPAEVLPRLFGIRAAGLLAALEPEAARARLSGLLIGAELAATRDLWEDRTVVILAASRLAAHYAEALRLAGQSSEREDVSAMTRAGLAGARAADRLR